MSRADLVDDIADVMLDTHDLDVTDRDYAEAVVAHLEASGVLDADLALQSLASMGQAAEAYAAQLQAEKERDALRAKANALIEIVEGISGAMTYGTWRSGKDAGWRLKDTPEWVEFYVANRNTGATK